MVGQTIYIGDTAIEEPLLRLQDELDLSAWERFLERAAQIRLPGWPVGLERALLARGLPEIAPAEVSLKHPLARAARFDGSGSVEHLQARPPSELAAWRLWEILDSSRLSTSDLLSLSRLLGGQPRLRGGEASTTRRSSGERFEYLKPELVPERLERLLRRLAERRPSLHPLLHAAAIYMDTLRIHPLPDGNGRLARLLFLGAFRQTVSLPAPLCPLGPALSRNRGHVLACYLAWELDGEPRPLVEFLEVVVAETLRSSVLILEMVEVRPAC